MWVSEWALSLSLLIQLMGQEFSSCFCTVFSRTLLLTFPWTSFLRLFHYSISLSEVFQKTSWRGGGFSQHVSRLQEQILPRNRSSLLQYHCTCVQDCMLEQKNKYKSFIDIVKISTSETSVPVTKDNASCTQGQVRSWCKTRSSSFLSSVNGSNAPISRSVFIILI